MTPPAPEGLLAFGLATVVLVALMLGLELLVRRGGVGPETTRRAAHVLACFYGAYSHSVLPLWLFVGACALFIVALAVSRRRALLAAVHTTRRRSFGEIYLPGGIIIAALAGAVAGSDNVFLAAVLILALSDVAAGVTGDLLRSTTKTWLGSLAFFVVTVAVVVACGFDPLAALALAVVATAVERLSSRGTDNLTVPFVAGALLAALMLI
jgi:dolichol kinase